MLWGQFRCFWYCDNNVLYNCKSQIVAIKNLLSVSSNCSQSTLMNKDALTHCSMIKVIFIVHNLIINSYTPYSNLIHWVYLCATLQQYYIFIMSTKYLATFLFLSLYLLRIRIMFVTTRSYIIMWRHPQLSTNSGQEKYKKKSEEKMEALEHKILSASVIVVLSLVFGYLPLILAKK